MQTRKLVGRTVALATALVGVAAVREQLRLPKEERTWHGAILGIPYDFRPPSLTRLRAAYWNPANPALFTARSFGVGWAINFYRLLHLNEPPALPPSQEPQ